jgi:hypothetical protein
VRVLAHVVIFASSIAPAMSKYPAPLRCVGTDASELPLPATARQ